VILVAGGSGFLGGAAVRALVAGGGDVAVMTAHPERSRARIEHMGARPVAGDVQHPATLPAAVEGAEVVVQALAFPTFPVEKPSKGYTFDEFERRGTERLVTAAVRAGARRYVYTSGVGADPNGPASRFRAKWAGEQAVAGSGIAEACVVRPSWVYGPEDRALNRFATLARRSPVIPVVGPGTQRLQPVFVDDVGTALARAAALGGPTGTFEIGGPDVFTMNEILETMLDVMELRRRLAHVPPWTFVAAGFPAQYLPKPPISPGVLEFLVSDALADTGPLLRAFPDLRPRPLREGLATYLAPVVEG
jgi:NADH dehydrogenase